MSVWVSGSVCHNFLKRYAFIATRCSGKIFNIMPPPPLPPECRALLFVTRKWRANYSWCIMLAPNLLEVITSLVWNFGHPVYGLTEKQYFLYWPSKDKFPYYHAYDQSFQQRAFIKCLLLQKFGKENTLCKFNFRSFPHLEEIYFLYWIKFEICQLLSKQAISKILKA